MKNIYRGVLLAVLIVFSVLLGVAACLMEQRQMPGFKEGVTDQSLVVACAVLVTCVSAVMAIIREIDWPGVI